MGINCINNVERHQTHVRALSILVIAIASIFVDNNSPIHMHKFDINRIVRRKVRKFAFRLENDIPRWANSVDRSCFTYFRFHYRN